MAGLVDWEAMVDRTRFLRKLSHWTSPADIILSARDSYRIDKWAEQDYRPEVFVEKDALIGVVEPVSQELDVPCFSCRGYVSASEMWATARRMAGHVERRQTPIIFHLGDHDPSGIQMTEDIRGRLNEVFGVEVEVRRIALNMDQIEQYNPPENPAKETDSRYEAYRAQYGDASYELDALNPTTLSELIRSSVEGVRDEDAWQASVEREEQDRADLEGIVARWGEVEQLVRSKPKRRR